MHRIRELHILVNDDAAAFKKGFLHRLKPITSLLHAPRLRKLTLPWQALATKGYKMGASSSERYDTTTRTRLPPSLEALCIMYPQLPTARSLQDLFGNVSQHNGRLQLVELRCSEFFAMSESILRAKQHHMLDALPTNVSIGPIEPVEANPCTLASTPA